MHKVYIILALLKLLSCVFGGSNKLEDHDCFESRDDSSILTCRTIPDCSKTRTILTYKHYKTIVFDLENRNALSSRSFYNCSFDFSLNIHFKNVKLLSSYSFDSIKVAPGQILNIKLDGSGLNLDKKSSQSKLFVNKLAFNNVVLESNSKLNIFIKNYERLFIRDTLVENMLWQSMFSEININVNNVDLVWFKSKSDRIVDVQLDLDDAERRKELESSDPKPVNLDPNAHYISNNLSYSLLINNVNDLVFDPSVYANVQVNTYSDFNVVIKMVKNVFMNSSLFDSLMLGFYSRFSLIVEDANKIGLSNGTFSALQLDQFSVFFTRIDRIGPKYSTKKSLTRREAKQETNNDYFLNDESVINVFDDDQSYQYDSVSGSVSYDYQYEETSDEPPSTYNQWLCVPESTFKNVRLAENALVQIHFIQVNFSLSITKNAFTEIQIDENAKFEMMFQDVKGHIVFDRGAVSMVTLTSGLFEIWIDNHRQKTAATTTNRVNNPSPKFNPKYKSSSLQPFRVFNAANKIYFKMFDFAINKIALNSGSNFRIGFINSDSVFSLSSKSIRNYHLGRFDSRKNNDDYRPKLELDLSGSENVNLDFLSVNQVNQSPSDDDDSDDSSSSMPKLIEIDGYLTLMSIVNADRSIELASSNQDSVAVSSDTIKENNSFIKKRLKLKSKSYLLDEFCQLFKLRPFMTSIKSDKHFGLRNNLIYFTDTSIKDFSKSKTGEAPEMCTSCLFIYLYRTIQRRADFFYVKDHLPKCFINLHFKDEKSLELLNSSTEKYKKEKYIKTIEESFKIYWKLLNCSSLTGLKSILDYNAEQNESDETLGDYEAIEKRCESMRAANEDETNSLDANSWHESALRICGKNTIDLNLNRANGLKKQTKKFSQISKRLPQNQLSFKITFLVVALFSFFTVIFIYFKYYKIDKPCIKINWRKRNSFQRLQNPSEIRYYTTRANQNQQNGDDEAEHPEQSYDEMQAYEYDDEFEINEGVSGVEASKLELDENIATSHLYTTSSNTENLEFRMDGNEFDSAPSSSGLFAKTRHPFKQMRRIKESFLSSSPKDLLISSLKKFPSYSYNSTDSTLVQNRANNELELAAAAKSASVVIYDSSKNRITPNLVKSAAEKIDEEEPRMRLALNPLEDLETVDNKSSTVNKIA